MRITDSQNNTVWAFAWYNGKLVSVTNAAGEEFEAITNYRGDVIQLVDATGETAASYEYDPWGNLLSKEPTDPRIQGQPIRYAGYVYDTETKLYYLQARYYDPATARFISRDPDTGDEDDPITMNGYTYADGNPVMMVDADGNMAHLVVYYAIVGGRTLYVSYKAYKVLKKAGKVTRVVRAPKVIKGTDNVLKTKSGFTLTKHAKDLLGNDRFKGKLTVARLDELMHSKDAIRVMDNRTGNINIYAKSEFSKNSLLRTTVAPDGKRIVSVGFEPLKRINKFIDSGGFTRIK